MDSLIFQSLVIAIASRPLEKFYLLSSIKRRAEDSFLSKKSKGVKKALIERLAIMAGIKNTKLKSLAVGIKPIGSVFQSFSVIGKCDRIPTALKVD